MTEVRPFARYSASSGPEAGSRGALRAARKRYPRRTYTPPHSDSDSAPMCFLGTVISRAGYTKERLLQHDYFIRKAQVIPTIRPIENTPQWDAHLIRDPLGRSNLKYFMD